MIRNLSFVLAAVIAFVAYLSTYTVYQTEQALVLRFGAIERQVQTPGLHYKMPFVENIIYIDKRLLSLDSPAEEIITANQKRLVVDAFAKYRITNPLKFVEATGGGSIAVANNRLYKILNSSVRQVMGGESLVSVVRDNRARIMESIQEKTNKDAQELGITVVDVKIRRADLPDANSESVFNRMKTEREQEAAEHRARGAQLAKQIRAKAEKEATVIVAEARKDGDILRGDGDAEKNRIYAEAFGKDAEFFKFYRSMQAYENSLRGENTTLVLSPDSDFFEYFGTSKK